MRNIPIALQNHLAQDATTLCLLTKVKTKDGTILAFTTLDADVDYDDGSGDGVITYSASNGFSPSNFQWVGDLSVDNAEATGWVQENGITEAQIRAGLFDFAKFWIYKVNYLDLSQGHWLHASGTTGQTKFSQNAWTVELRSKTQQLKQPLADLYSLTCPVKFGSPQCGKAFSWATFTVDTPDSIEPDRKFSVVTDGAWPADGTYTYGVIEVLDGDNAGVQVEVELQSGLNIELLLPLPYPMADGVQFKIREDCNKVARDETHGCKHHWGTEWPLHFRGQSKIPLADAASLQVPGAQTPSIPGRGSSNNNDPE